jgi:hypothetical protein
LDGTGVADFGPFGVSDVASPSQYREISVFGKDPVRPAARMQKIEPCLLFAQPVHANGEFPGASTWAKVHKRRWRGNAIATFR